MLTRHVPVLADRCLELLAPALATEGAVLIDATLGLGGHAEVALQQFANLQVIGIDRDPQALALATSRLAPFGDRFTAVHAVYDELPTALAALGITEVQGILFDLGVSSMQLDEDARGFAYSRNAPLDMRMDQSTGRTAADIVNTYPAADLIHILRTYGEEKFADRIVRAVVRAREMEPFTDSGRLAELVRDAIPAATRRTGGNPAKRTFQALRIEVNDELGVLRRAIPSALGLLAVGGRIVVLSYHSLEDRIVKQAFAEGAKSKVPADLPVIPAGSEPWLRLIAKETAGPEEVQRNPRAASVRLRAAERVAA